MRLDHHRFSCRKNVLFFSNPVSQATKAQGIEESRIQAKYNEGAFSPTKLEKKRTYILKYD